MRWTQRHNPRHSAGLFDDPDWNTLREVQLAPGLLLSMPQLDDPHFSRAVVLMLEHNDAGSFGIIVNQQSTLKVADLVATLEVRWQGDMKAAVFSGGPVMPGSGWILHGGSEHLPGADSTIDAALEGSGTVRVMEGLYVSSSEENIKLLSLYPPEHIRVLLGYAGWSAGQLASEMARGSWLHADIDIDILFGAPVEDMWQRFLDKMGIDPESIVQSLGVH